MQLITSNNQTMSSKEMAELTEKRHDSVKRTIDSLAANGVISYPQSVDGEKAANGVIEKLYLIGKRDTYIIVAQLSPEFTARLVDRWQELETQQQFKIPTTLSGALRLAAEQAETIEAQQLVIEQQKPSVEFVERYVEARSSKCLSDVAKILKWKPQEFIRELAANGVLFKRGGAWIPHQCHIDAGRFTVTTGEGNGHAYHQTRVEPDGIVWLAKNYKHD